MPTKEGEFFCNKQTANVSYKLYVSQPGTVPLSTPQF